MVHTLLVFLPFYFMTSHSSLTAYFQLEAEDTKKFWETCHLKMAEALRTPCRRLLRESRTHPINVHNAGRFSSHSFVLLTDILVHLQYSNFTTYSLNTMWVEASSSVPNVQVRQNFKIHSCIDSAPSVLV